MEVGVDIIGSLDPLDVEFDQLWESSKGIDEDLLGKMRE